MFERFTRAARQVVVDARAQAVALGHRQVGTEHLLLALLEPGATPASTILYDFGLTADGVRAGIARKLGESGRISDADAAALETIGIDIRAIEEKLEASFGPGALHAPAPPPRGHVSPRVRKVLELSLREALRLRHKAIGTEHLLLGLIREGQGLAAQIMAEAGIDFAALRRAAELRQAA